MSFSCPWGKIMLYSAVCFQVSLTPEKYSLVHYVSTIVEQARRAWDLRYGFRPHPAKSVLGGSLFVENWLCLGKRYDDSVSEGTPCQTMAQETLCLQLFCSFQDLNWERLTKTKQLGKCSALCWLTVSSSHR